MSNSKLVGDFKLLREHCVLLRRHYNTYTNLYNEGNHNLLNKVAPTFFSDIAEIMHRDWILQACKLMDPANTKRKDSILENITIKLVNEQLERRGWLSQTINNISEEILEYGDKIKP
ncbi:MAG: hypothetical protein GY834_05460, partial [Bacteroidetes bacterium]|nr:hypothetical protein [Bacteroidota bacterium]